MRITIAQTPGSELRDWRRALRGIHTVIAEAAACRSDLLLLPECVWPACFFESPAAFFAERKRGMPASADVLADLCAAARQNQLCICTGYVEETATQLFNAAGFIDRDGKVVGTHRKVFRWDTDHDCFGAGDSIEPFDTEFGRIGIMICADARLPEIPATLVARGARLLLQPTAWVNAGTAESWRNPQPEFLIPSRAAELGVPIASANKWGREWNTTTVGTSILCDERGRYLARCVADHTHVITCDVALPATRAFRVEPSLRRVLCADDATRETARSVAPLDVALGVDERDVVDAGGEHALRIASAKADTAGESTSTSGALAGPTREMFVWRGATIAALPCAALRSFAPLRVAAIHGVHLAVVFGDDIDDRHLRTRAAENRIFVLAVEGARYRLVDPRGVITQTHITDAGPKHWTIDVAQAAEKQVVPRTDVIRDRTPGAYEF